MDFDGLKENDRWIDFESNHVSSLILVSRISLSIVEILSNRNKIELGKFRKTVSLPRFRFIICRLLKSYSSS